MTGRAAATPSRAWQPAPMCSAKSSNRTGFRSIPPSRLRRCRRVRRRSAICSAPSNLPASASLCRTARRCPRWAAPRSSVVARAPDVGRAARRRAHQHVDLRLLGDLGGHDLRVLRPAWLSGHVHRAGQRRRLPADRSWPGDRLADSGFLFDHRDSRPASTAASPAGTWTTTGSATACPGPTRGRVSGPDTPGAAARPTTWAPTSGSTITTPGPTLTARATPTWTAARPSSP